MAKKVILLAGIASALFLAELSSWGLLYFKNDLPKEPFARSYAQEASGYSAEEFGNASAFKKWRKPHPYFGFINNHGNNFGFSDKRDFPYSPKSDEFVIGIFGGSVANAFARYIQDSNSWEGLKIPGKENKKVVVLNFALSGGKQPQQFIIGSYFLDRYIDLAVLIDGWKEATTMRVAPVEYPEGYEVLFNQGAGADHDQISFEQTLWRLVNRYLSTSVLSNSYSLRLVWSGMKKRHSKRVAEYSAQLNNPNSLNPSPEENFYIWKKYFNYFKQIASYNGVPVFHFFPPNPFFEGAKPLTDQERAVAQISYWQSSSDLIKQAKKFYEMYRSHKDFQSTDLTYLFRNVREQVYKDEHIHLNERGNGLMAKAIGNSISTGGRGRDLDPKD